MTSTNTTTITTITTITSGDATAPGDNDPTTGTAPNQAGASSAGGAPRLRNGELRAMVAGHLAAHPGKEFTPTQVAKGLGGRSAGAVANALAALTAADAVEQTSVKPVRYRATAHTAAAAAAPVKTGSAAPSKKAPSTKASGTKTSGKSGSRSSATSPPQPPAPPAPGSAATNTGTNTPGAAAAKTRSAAQVETVTGPVARPNGQMYHPRTVAGIPDVTALRKPRAAGVAAMLYGPPGTGKTSLIEAAFPDLVTVQGDGDMTVADLVGEYTQTPDGRYVFVHGPLVAAMREGRPLFLDDATLVPPTVLAVLYPAMDGRREITIKANGGERVTAADGFYVVAGHNPGVHGTVLTDALSSRFSAQIQVSSDYTLARELGVNQSAVKVAARLATRQTAGEVGWAPQLRELLSFDRVEKVLGLGAATANLVGSAPEEDRDIVAAVVRDVFGRATEPLALGARI